MLFLAAVVGVALRHGRGPAALASVLSVAANWASSSCRRACPSRSATCSTW
ncbi:hypothetical protein ACU4GD_02445 [Cupriavidus basilensis]